MPRRIRNPFAYPRAVRRACTVMCVLVSACIASAQNVQTHQVPFASSDNLIELTVFNNSSEAYGEMILRVEESPAWIRLSSIEEIVPGIEEEEGVNVRFGFSVDRKAPVAQTGMLRFVLSNSAGERWTKEIQIEVLPPEEFRLFQNFPNPFNPATTISYQLPHAAWISLAVYNLLGQKVATLVDEMQSAGYYESAWEVTRLASGTYFYELRAEGVDGATYVDRKKLMVVK